MSFKRLKEQNGATLEDVVSMKCVHKEFYLALGTFFEQVKGKCKIAKIISSKVNGLDGNLQYSKKKTQVDKIYLRLTGVNHAYCVA
mgnify:FL=1